MTWIIVPCMLATAASIASVFYLLGDRHGYDRGKGIFRQAIEEEIASGKWIITLNPNPPPGAGT